MKTSLRRMCFVMLLVLTGILGAFRAWALSGEEVLISGSNWLNGQGVDAHYNGGLEKVWGSSYVGSTYVGLKWQCVELAQRLYTVRGWYSGAFPYKGGRVPSAVTIYDAAPGMGMEAHPNNSGYVPVPGDMIILSGGSYGHVGIVDKVEGGTVWTVEQNWSSDGRFNYTISGSNITSSRDKLSYPVRGIVHSPKNSNSNTNSGGGGGGSSNPICESDLNAYLSGSRLAGMASSFIKWGSFFNVDPRLVVGVAQAESSLGNNACGANETGTWNAWGWFGGRSSCWTEFRPGLDSDTNRSEFSTAPGFVSGQGITMSNGFEDGIFWVTRSLRREYLNRGQSTVNAIQQAGHSYCTTGCDNWIPNVNVVFAKTNGDPNKLDFPGVSTSCGGGGGGGGNAVTTVVDDSNGASGEGQPGFWKYGTASFWKTESGVGQNGSMTYTGVNGNTLNNMADWRPNLPVGGRYEVFAFIPRRRGSTHNAPYEIYHADGRTDVKIDQYSHYDEWVSLGTYNWNAGNANLVRLIDKTGETYNPNYGGAGVGGPNIAFDAMKWEPRGYAVGQGSSRQQFFIDAYNRNGGAATVGIAVNTTHWWGDNRPVVIQDFSGGSFGNCAIIDDEARGTGAWVIRGDMWTKFISLGGPEGFEGILRSDEGTATSSPQGTTGAVQTFERGHFHASKWGTFFTVNQIDAKYASIGGSGGDLGFPRSDEFPVDSAVSGLHGWVNVFEGGHIFHTNELGTYVTKGDINSRYAAMGSMGSLLGFPKAEQSQVSDGHVVQDYENGSFYSYAKGTFFVVGDIKKAYASASDWQGEWGWPLRDQNSTTSSLGTPGAAQDFDTGTAFTSPKGTFFTKGSIKNKYAAQGWEHGSLGFPISAQYAYLGGVRQDFEGGSLTSGVVIALKLGATSVVGGTNASGTVTLGGVAPSGGVRVNVTGSDIKLVGSSSIVVPTGKSSATFSLSTAKVTATVSVTITAALGDVDTSATLRLTPPLVVAHVPTIVSVLHANGLATASSPATQEHKFTEIIQDLDGASTITDVGIWLGRTYATSPSLYAFYDVTKNVFYLRSDDGKTMLGGFAPGSATFISNKWGRINMATTTVRRAGQSVIVTWSFTPNASMVGTQPVIAHATDVTGQQVGWRQTGNWTITTSGKSTHSIESNPPVDPSAPGS